MKRDGNECMIPLWCFGNFLGNLGRMAYRHDFRRPKSDFLSGDTVSFAETWGNLFFLEVYCKMFLFRGKRRAMAYGWYETRSTSEACIGHDLITQVFCESPGLKRDLAGIYHLLCE
jgi:hypothetical protein